MILVSVSCLGASEPIIGSNYFACVWSGRGPQALWA